MDTRGQMNEEGWLQRYKLEAELKKLFEEEEMYWRQRGGDRELLEGDANTSYLHMSANGRKRKNTVVSLDHDGMTVTDQNEIRDIIYGYYKQLFGAEAKERAHLAANAWEVVGRVDEEQRTKLVKPFTIEEAEQVVKEMMENTAPGPDGLSVTFFKNFWETIKWEIKSKIDMISVEIPWICYV